jgi:hypothetical protein
VDPATIIALILAGTKTVTALVGALDTLHSGAELTPDQLAVIDGELEAAKARNTAAIDAAIANAK